MKEGSCASELVDIFAIAFWTAGRHFVLLNNAALIVLTLWTPNIAKLSRDQRHFDKQGSSQIAATNFSVRLTQLIVRWHRLANKRLVPVLMSYIPRDLSALRLWPKTSVLPSLSCTLSCFAMFRSVSMIKRKVLGQVCFTKNPAAHVDSWRAGAKGRKF